MQGARRTESRRPHGCPTRWWHCWATPVLPAQFVGSLSKFRGGQPCSGLGSARTRAARSAGLTCLFSQQAILSRGHQDPACPKPGAAPVGGLS